MRGGATVSKQEDPVTTHYAAKVKELRTSRAWSQEQLATIADVNVRTVQRVEHGHGASFETLTALANAFDVDVGELLIPPPVPPAGEENQAKPSGQRVLFLGRVRTGRALFAAFTSAHMYHFEHDELVDLDEVDLVASFFQGLHDCTEIWSDLEPADRVRIPHDFNARIDELEHMGFWIFVGARQAAYKIEASIGSEVIQMNTATALITKSTNPAIIRLEGEDSVLPVTYSSGPVDLAGPTGIS